MGVGKERETGLKKKKKKKTSGSLDRGGRKTKGRRDTTPREGCVCLCMRLHVRAIERPSFCSEKGGSQGGPGASSHLGSLCHQLVRIDPSSRGGRGLRAHTGSRRSAKLSAWSMLAASTCWSTPELRLSLPGGWTLSGLGAKKSH